MAAGFNGQPQQYRHNQIVAYHRAQGNGFDNDHSGCGRHAAEVDKQGDKLLVLGHREREDKCVGIDTAVGEPQNAAERHRHNKNIDGQKIEREKPDGFVEMLLINVFHHGDLELAGQKDNGQHGNKHINAPVHITVSLAFYHQVFVKN